MTAPVLSKPGMIDWEDVKRRIAAAIEQTEALLGSAGPGADREARFSPATDSDGMPNDGPAEVLKVATFELSGCRLALDVHYICEIVPIGRLSPIPGLQPYVRGVYDRRGQLLPVFDLCDLFDLSPALPSDTAWALVCGKEQAEFLVLVETTPELREIALETLAPAKTEGMELPWAQAIAGDGTVVIDAPLLFNDRRLFLGDDQASPEAEDDAQ
ncbi:Chemotaxis signal transduction protein (plasmid) [Sinorhizobium sojae CCBAU 05684]|uniref:Chemotaxis signal transduction protein n=1 Tax=Sinorhizobium sojae CCBAU 05684 TaxID=716928 RepID=A0A249PHT9_9HYPH|nr:chemotaxis protein CheW [Sinorhizobium sojae]ASY65503.1 Chemotaxis signal transduction protein [Sinorhizobium sojae CCBAU 05684]